VTDARFPERWLNDRRVLRLTDAEFRTFVTTLAWSVSNRTDGAISTDDLGFVLGSSVGSAPGLVRAALWTLKDNGWHINDYATTQTSAHELEILDNYRRTERVKKAKHRGAKANLPTPDPDTDTSPVHGDVHGDMSTGRSTGTAKDRTGKARTGQEEENLATNLTQRVDDTGPIKGVMDDDADSADAEFFRRAG